MAFLQKRELAMRKREIVLKPMGIRDGMKRGVLTFLYDSNLRFSCSCDITDYINFGFLENIEMSAPRDWKELAKAYSAWRYGTMKT
jgi:hypothetical protein